MSNARRVLISGAGVAGLAAAHWLARGGVEVVVVEKATTRRLGGYLVGLAGQAYQDAKTLGVMPALRKRESGIIRSRYLDGRGRALLNLDYRRLFKGVDIIQMMRDDLVEGVFDSAQHLAEIRFGDSISSLVQDASGVNVCFDSGKIDRFDAVIGADGQHSNVRQLIFSSADVSFQHLGLMCAAYRLPNILDLQSIFETHMDHRRYMNVFTTRHGDLGAIFVWQCKDEAAPSPEDRQHVLSRAFRAAPVMTKRVIDQCPSEGRFYMDPTVQTIMPHWYQGRVALIGDAAHALTLFSGRGAAAAFIDAGHLGRALASLPVDQAFETFQKTRLEHIGKIQRETKSAVNWYVPSSIPQHLLRNGAMALLPNRLFEAYFHKKYSAV